MKFLRLKKHRVRADGVRSVLPVIVEKNRKFGLTLSEQKISVRQDVLITGAHQAGKTRWLSRMEEEAAGIWRNKPVVMLRVVNPLISWVHNDAISGFGEEMLGKPWTKTRCWERSKVLVEWVRVNKAVVLIDDADKLSSRKLDIALQVLRVSGQAVVTASHENRLPVSFRMVLQSRNPQRINLKTDAPYDVTVVVVWFLSLAAMSAGAWQLAAVIAGLNMFKSGRRAARQT